MPVELNKEEIAFLTNYVLIQEDEFNNLDTMKQKVEYYLEFIKNLKLIILKQTQNIHLILPKLLKTFYLMLI